MDRLKHYLRVYKVTGVESSRNGDIVRLKLHLREGKSDNLWIYDTLYSYNIKHCKKKRRARSFVELECEVW